MKNSSFALFLVWLVSSSLSLTLDAQCVTWLNSPKKDEAETAHTLYRDALKAGKILDAMPNWEKAYSIAPAADGLRDWHYSDGITIYKAIFEKETDPAKKQAALNKINELYAGMKECYKAKVIKVNNCNSEDCVNKKLGDISAQQATDMYYSLRSPYPEVLKILADAVTLSGTDALYTVFVPYADIAVYQFLNKELSKEDARAIYQKLNEIAEFNITKNKRYGNYYKDALAYSNAKFLEIEDFIFDCEYFKEKLTPDYRKDPENHELIKTIFNKLSSKGCTDKDSLMVELKDKFEKIVAEENARRKAEYEASNPIYMAKKLIDEGNFEGAIEKYKDAIDSAHTNEDKGELVLSIASLQFRKLGQTNNARESARRAANLKPNWGAPYLLIGDMYVSGARNCDDDWGSRLAVIAAIDKYQYARSIDPSMASDANDRIDRITSALPEKEDGFMRQVKEGQTLTVPCWIGESVKVRFKT